MNKINLYIINLSIRYIFLNLIIISIFVMFLNLIELSRILQNNDNSFFNYFYLSILKLPSILNQIIPFVTIIAISFLFRNLINNNELVSMRNIGYSIFDIFYPIGISVFLIGLFFLTIINPISANFENKFEELINKKDQSLYSIKVSNNEMWIKNSINKNYSSFINIKKIDLKDMNAKNIKILLVDKNSNKFIQAKEGKFKNNNFILKDVIYYDVDNEYYKKIDDFNLIINFNKENIINSIDNYKLIPFYNYYTHTQTMKKFNLYSSEIGLFYLSEIFKPLFIVMLSFVIVGFSGKFKRNENFFKILFISILIGFLVFFFKEIIIKLTVSLSINFFVSYLIIFFVPFSIGLYQVINIEND